MKARVTRLAYCQYLLVSQINYTLTNFADHSAQFSHDAINRYLWDARLTPRLLWEHVAPDLVPTSAGYVIFDDTVLDKNFSFAIELVRRQYSGNARTIIKGIGVVTCVYVNPATDQFWLIDYRIYDPEGDGKTKQDHVRDMLGNVVFQKQVSFHAVLMDLWYATKDLMLYIESLHKLYYCPVKGNCHVDDRAAATPIAGWMGWRGAPRSAQRGNRSRSKAFPTAIACGCSGSRRLLAARTGL